MTDAPELEAAKLWRDVIRRRHMMEDAAPADKPAATCAYDDTMAAYRAVTGATLDREAAGTLDDGTISMREGEEVAA